MPALQSDHSTETTLPLRQTPRAVAPKKPVTKPVIGASVANTHVKSVHTKRCVDIFVSRLHPETKNCELIDSVYSVTDQMHLLSVECTKLKSKYADLYSSFYIAVHVDSIDFKSAIDIMMSPESWPSGMFIKRYFKPKNGSKQ